MEMPIIVHNKGDVLVFETVEAAQGYIEPVDVINNEYVAYDNDGRLLRISVASKNKILIKQDETMPTHAQELSRVLKYFFERIGVDPTWLKQASLQDLIVKSLDYRTN
jgi:hypothetical protein